MTKARNFTLLAAAAFLLVPVATAQQPSTLTVDDVWTGGVGNWSNASMWTNGVPNGDFNVFIDNNNPVKSSVALDINAAVDNLTISDQLSLNPGTILTVNGQFSNSGIVLVNKAATLNLAASGGLNGFGALEAYGGKINVKAGGFTNNGAIDLENGGTLTVTGNLINGASIATNAKNMQGASNTLTITGTYSNNLDGGIALTIGANDNTSDQAFIGLFNQGGTITVGKGASLTLTQSGADLNSGSINLNGTLNIPGQVALTGVGSVNMTNATVSGLGSNATLSDTNFINGSGTISNLGLTVSGTGSIAAAASSTLTILPNAAGLNNQAYLSVGTAGLMRIGTSAGGALLNYSGGTLTGGSYGVSGTLQFGATGSLIATNAAFISLDAAGAQIINFGGQNMLSGFTRNTPAGSFTMSGGATLATTGGNFTNLGIFTVSAGSTFTVGGSTSNFTQTAGVTTVDGALTSAGAGVLSLNGGSLYGSGTIGFNVVDSGLISPGENVPVAGTLTVADTYKQNSNGTLDISLKFQTHDALRVLNTATLGGTLNISLSGNFTATVGQTFTILTASAVSGIFATVNGLAINSSEHFAISYNPSNVVLTVVSGPLPGAPTVSASHPGRGRYGSAVYVPKPVMVAANPFRPREIFPGPAPSYAVPAPVASVHASANPLGRNFHRLECGVDLKALIKTSPRQVLRGLRNGDANASPIIGYLAYTGTR